MINIFAVIILYIIWTILDFINLFIIYKYFFFVEKIKPKRSRVIWFFFMFMISLLLAFTDYYCDYGKIQATLLFILFMLRMVPVIWQYFKRRYTDILIILLYNLIIPAISQGLYNITGSKGLNGFNEQFVYDKCQLFISFLFFLFLIFILILRKKNIINLYFIQLSVFQHIIFSIALFSADLLELETIYVFPDNDGIHFRTFFNVIIICILMGQIVIVKELDSRKQNVIELLNEQMNGVTESYNELVVLENQTKKFRHDIKNHLFILHSLVESNKNIEAIDYIEKMSDICQYSKQKFDTGNFFADALLSVKSRSAEDKNIIIQFEGYIPNHIIENIDMVILLSNLIDNAIEASEKVGKEKKIIINSLLQNSMWILIIKNPTLSSVPIINNNIETSKSDTMNHGFGIQNIKNVVKKYNGNVNFLFEKGIFTACAKLNCKRD